ncbi:hypothetical protein [Halostella salina]|uniref:hypothetical protein n=1 Tax=Halostella salina TaxID=1547897 RepID=UPI000EF79058|nr:hypothetical protein [Halostella salina]
MRVETTIECTECGDTVMLDTAAVELACSCEFAPLASLPDAWRVIESGEPADAGTNPGGDAE